MTPDDVKLLCASLLLLPALNLTGCASSQPTPPGVLPQLPPPPSLTTPLPPVDYSLTAAQRIKTWRQKLMGTQVMSAP